MTRATREIERSGGGSERHGGMYRGETERTEVVWIMKTPDELMVTAVGHYNPVAIYVGFSGGRDSLAVTHWVMSNYPQARVFHINTGIGIELTRQYVRDMCEKYGWPLDEVRAKEDCGQDYDEIVKSEGFPGPFSHRFIVCPIKGTWNTFVDQKRKEKPR